MLIVPSLLFCGGMQMDNIESTINKLQEDIIKVNINVNAVDRELFYNTLTITKAMTAKINENFAQFECFKNQLENLKEAIDDLGVHTRSMTNGGLKEALQSILPTIITSITSKEIENNKGKTAMIIAIVGASGTLLGLVLPHILQILAR